MMCDTVFVVGRNLFSYEECTTEKCPAKNCFRSILQQFGTLSSIMELTGRQFCQVDFLNLMGPANTKSFSTSFLIVF